DEGYCYVVHSGMIAYPMVEFARLVREAGLEEELGWDGTSFGHKATSYVAAAEATVAAHDDQWNDAGYYVFRPDASFLSYPGTDLPLNQSNAMGRLLLALHAVTGNGDYGDKATKLAQRFKAQLSTGSNGAYLWNYWGGSYTSPGEDISHAAINVDFAAMAAEQGIIFDASDLDAFSKTFMGPVYVDDRTLSNNVGGGDTNGSSYKPQCARWLRLASTRTAVYAAIRDVYELGYAPASVGSGSLLYGWAALAEHEPIHRDHFFYSVDWIDEGDWREAEAYAANILTTPPDLDAPAVVVLPVDVPRATNVQQWDGSDYHTVVRWLPTGGAAVRWMPYEPRWPFVYWNDGVLYQFADAFVAGDGIRVKESAGFELPTISSSPPAVGAVGTPFDYMPVGAGTGPTWWTLTQFPIGARIDPSTGVIAWTPTGPGIHAFTLRLENDYGHAEQAFSVVVHGT
ncbi:MAG: Ig domain-containing protein, partial [Myxococcota bacterium]